jgi:hypothetical protein
MDAEENRDWQEPPIPEEIKPNVELPEMSEPATLGNIFIEPGRTFEDLRRKPRFILAIVIMALAFAAFQVAFVEKIGFEKIVRARLESNTRVQQMPGDEREKMIEQQTQPFIKYISYAITPIAIVIVMFLGGLLYWGGANAMGGTITYLRSVSVWTYSSFPPLVISILANFIILFLKNVDDIDLTSGQQGLVQANPTMFLNLKGSPALETLLSSLDLFAIWGYVLGAIGLQKVGKLSSGLAWATVLIIAFIFLTIRVVWAAIFG